MVTSTTDGMRPSPFRSSHITGGVSRNISSVESAIGRITSRATERIQTPAANAAKASSFALRSSLFRPGIRKRLGDAGERRGSYPTFAEGKTGERRRAGPGELGD